WNNAILPIKQLNMPEPPNLEEKKDGFYAVVLNANYHLNSNGLYIMSLDEEHLGKEFFIDLPEPRFNPYPLSENDYQADVYLDKGDLIYMNFSGEYEMLGNGEQGYMHFTKEDSIQWCGNAFAYLETTPYVATKYIKEKHLYEYTNSVTGTTLEAREYSPYMSLNDSVVYLTYHDVPLYPIEWVENPKKYSFKELTASLKPFYLVLDSGITVQKIGHKIPDTPEWQEYKEYFQVPDYKFKQQACEVLQMNDGLNGQLDGQEAPKTGDLLRINFTGSIAEIYPGCMHFNKEDTIENLGNITEIATLKDLTVADAETNTVTLKDADGEIYYYQKGDLSFYDEFGSAYTTFNPKAGETITFYMYENEPILPKLDDSISVNPVPTVTATGDADGSGELDILDIITVNKAILGKEILSEDKISYVDFNGNGVPDADDALTMLKMLVGLI
ncbi:MAG: dockerin type I repeat-containing protein, partial [Oscillospiraceae bacterium]|nr:dockerin type I repeat-containing protein [Oscillospiraceae bacterium]